MALALFDGIAAALVCVSDFARRHQEILVVLFTGIVALFTGLLYRATKQLAGISDRQNETARASERAYVTLSHRPPGLKFDDNVDSRQRRMVSVEIEVKNYGRTPATVGNVVVELFSERAGAIPLLGPSDEKTSAFLVSGGYINVEPWFIANDEVWALGRNGSGADTLRLRGRVAYTDKFGDQHVGAYERIYQPHVDIFDEANPDRNNLVFERGARGNYDRLRRPDDPDEWVKEAQQK